MSILLSSFPLYKRTGVLLLLVMYGALLDIDMVFNCTPVANVGSRLSYMNVRSNKKTHTLSVENSTIY